jgi:Holliday junction resolvase RusA-like endonuclease
MNTTELFPQLHKTEPCIPQYIPTLREISFVVHGTPRPQGSKKFVGFGKSGHGKLIDASKQLKPWRNLVGQVAANAFGDQPLFTGAIELILDFHFARPKSHYRTGRNAHILKNNAPKYHTKKPDFDKLTRAIADALTAIIYRDDSQVFGGHIIKQYAPDGHGSGVRITVKELQ